VTEHVFVTVGAQMAFDRLVHAVDEWAQQTDRDVEVFIQAGPTERPPRTAHVDSLDPAGFADRMEWADVVVSHAGMGTILSALVDGVPLVLLPRRGALMETRNDHQVGTVDRFGEKAGITAVADEHELVSVLERGDWSQPDTISPTASPQLIERLRSFIEGAERD
jgi:UDP-N-acetylglucosamine transferase subunit ALG13